VNKRDERGRGGKFRGGLEWCKVMRGVGRG